jgi:hypothetical protein
MPRSAADIRYAAILGKRGELRLPSKEIADELIAQGVLFDVELTDKLGANRYYGVKRPYTLKDVEAKLEEMALAAV